MKYIRKFLKSVSTTGALCPVSTSSIQKILGIQTSQKNRERDRTKKLSIIEYGPGLGGFTREILAQMSHDSTLVCFEINSKDFKDHLDKIDDPRLTIHYVSCEEVETYIEKNSIDLIVSTIPFSLIGKDTTLNILKASKNILKSGGTFITGQYRSFAEPLLEKVFGHSIHTRHLNNLPPLQIMKAVK